MFFKQQSGKIGYDIDERKMGMEKLIIYKKQIITTIIIIVISVICFGVYILHTTLNNINYSKSEACGHDGDQPERSADSAYQSVNILPS